ncbi:MAG: hypothetical protein H6701_06600 [Myxococcales bacterium]|nr:hypothetical protein [Myxococcales bacterium]
MARQTPQPGDEIDLDAWLTEGESEPPPPRQRGVMMRHPLLLIAVLGAAVFLLVKSWPRTAYMFASPVECGDIAARPELRRVDPDAVAELPTEGLCHLVGVSQSRGNLATGEPRDDTEDPYEKNAGRKIYVKLVGDRVFAVLPASRAVLDYRMRQDGLVGYPIDAVGRIFDPDTIDGYGDTAETLRLKFSVPSGEPIRIFDTTDAPGDRWPYLIVSIVLALTALLALYGLIRLVLARRG